MLLHIVVHGVRWNPEPPIRWIPDATFVLRAAGDSIDWDRLVQSARTMKVTYRLQLGLNYLADQGFATIPEVAFRSLREYRVSMVERVENTIALHDREAMYRHPLLKYWVIFAEYCRQDTAHGPIGFLAGFSHYLRYRLQLPGRRHILRELVSGTARRIARRLGGT